VSTWSRIQPHEIHQRPHLIGAHGTEVILVYDVISSRHRYATVGHSGKLKKSKFGQMVWVPIGAVLCKQRMRMETLVKRLTHFIYCKDQEKRCTQRADNVEQTVCRIFFTTKDEMFFVMDLHIAMQTNFLVNIFLLQMPEPHCRHRLSYVWNMQRLRAWTNSLRQNLFRCWLLLISQESLYSMQSRPYLEYHLLVKDVVVTTNPPYPTDPVYPTIASSITDDGIQHRRCISWFHND